MTSPEQINFTKSAEYRKNQQTKSDSESTEQLSYI